MKGALQRRRRSSGVPVPRWYPGRGSAFHAPPAGVFYSTKVRARLDWWRQNNASSSVIRALQAGVKLDFTAGPPRPLRTAPLLVKDQDVAFMLEDLAKGDRLGAYQPLISGAADYLARARVHAQPGGKRRTILNFRHVNAACRKYSCRYEGIKDLPALLRPGDWMLSLDLSAAFWHVPLHVQAAKYLSFHFALPQSFVDEAGVRHATPIPPGAYVVDDYIVVERSCRSLPFGFTNSPFTFTKVIKVIAKAMRRKGFKCLWFLDDCLVALPTRGQAMRARAEIETLLERSGFTRAVDKGCFAVATQILPDHLGFEISTEGPRGCLRVPARRCRDISIGAKDLLCRAARHKRRVPTELLRAFLGRATSVIAAVDKARFWLRSLHDVTELFSETSTLDRAALRDLQVWAAFSLDSPANGRPLWPEDPSAAIYTDASGTIGFGSVVEAPAQARTSYGHLFERPHLPGSFAQHAAGGGLQGHGCRVAGGFWSPEERILFHITLKELIAVRKGLLVHAHDLRGRVVRLWEDNLAVVHIIRNRTSKSHALMAELRLLLLVLDELHIDLRPRYIRSELNPADFYSRLVDRDAWSLRPSVAKMILTQAKRRQMPAISLDPFGCAQFALCKRFASRLFDPNALASDGLALNWRHEHGTVWLNPPWALLPACIAKLAQERPAAVLIVPEWPTQVWWPSLLALGGRHLRLPRPKFCVMAHHGRLVEPFVNASIQLLAVLLPR